MTPYHLKDCNKPYCWNFAKKKRDKEERLRRRNYLRTILETCEDFTQDTEEGYPIISIKVS